MDEAHHAGAPTWQYVANSCVNAHDRLGLSGTMAVRDKVAEMRIEGALGPTFTAGATAELADLGFVATPRMVMLFCPPTTYPSYEEVREAVCPNWRDDPRRIIGASGGKLFRHAYERGVIENETRNRIVVGTAVRHAEAGDKFLVLCNRVPHAEALFAAVSQRLSRPSYVLSGGADEWLRDETLGSFKAVDGGAVLVCTPFFREGVSVPQIDAGFLAGAGESEIAILQAMGRMLTKRPGKDEVLIYDVLDGRDPRQEKDYLAQHRLSRVATYVRSKFRVERG